MTPVLIEKRGDKFFIKDTNEEAPKENVPTMDISALQAFTRGQESITRDDLQSQLDAARERFADFCTVIERAIDINQDVGYDEIHEAFVEAMDSLLTVFRGC